MKNLLELEKADELWSFVIDEAKKAPVHIGRYGKIEGVLLSIRDYQYLTMERGRYDEMLIREKNLNQEVYEEMKKELQEKYKGKYVNIAKGKLIGVGDSWEDVKDLAKDALHCLVFKVE